MADTKRVLVVDDDAEIRELLASVLRRRGLTADVAADGAEALDLLRQNIYSVVLLDLLMPNIDGFAVLGELDSALAPP
ncbi:MAG TPA: response regulator, partial [Thermoanaerobaculia bacterium]